MTQEPRPLPIPDYSGETQVCDRQQKAEEEQKRFDKGLALSRIPSRRLPRQFTTPFNLALLPAVSDGLRAKAEAILNLACGAELSPAEDAQRVPFEELPKPFQSTFPNFGAP